MPRTENDGVVHIPTVVNDRPQKTNLTVETVKADIHQQGRFPVITNRLRDKLKAAEGRMLEAESRITQAAEQRAQLFENVAEAVEQSLAEDLMYHRNSGA
ncbi:MAG: hypothetical protein WC551_13420 [Patescibacteria group bacterium]